MTLRLSTHHTILLCAAVLCCFSATTAAASTSGVNSTTTLTPAVVVNVTTESSADHGNNASHETGGEHKGHKIHVLAVEFEAVEGPLIFTVVVLLAGLSKIGFHHANFLASKIPESVVLIILGIIFGAILVFSGIGEGLPDLFDPHGFFLFLLPPIILEASFSLYDRTFSENIGTVLLFAVVGTIIACFVIGLCLYGLMVAGAMGAITNMSLVQIFVFSALIVAVDPVAVLAVFSEIGVNDVLYFIVFGESLLNDGVTVVLYKVMQSFNLMDTITAGQVVLGIVKFFVVCFGGLFIGIICGLVSALLTRLTTHVGVAQPLVIFTMAYLGYLMSELFEVSGIISIIGCGLLQRHYAFDNISHKSRTTVKYFTKVLASASEIIIFLFLGLELVSEHHEWHTGFVLWTLLLCTVFRFLITFGIASLVNRFDSMRVRRIGYDEMFMIAFGGLRGAVAFSLAALLDKDELPMKPMFVTTTLAVVVFTVFVQGITIKPLVNCLSITLAPGKNQSMYCELSSHVTDHLMAGIEDVVGMRGRNHIREKLEHLDNLYLKKWMKNEPDPTDTSLQDFYTKIVIKEHYKNLKLCGAANVDVPVGIPHIDTSMYLASLGADKEDVLVAKKAAEEVEPQEPRAEKPVLRKRKSVRRETPSDLQGLRNLLKQQRNTRLNLHSTYDRNLVSEERRSLQRGIVDKSAHNRRLQRLMSTTSCGRLERCSSWTENSAEIAQNRHAEASTASGATAASKRAVSLDLGSQAVSFSLSQKLTSTATSGLSSVSEEGEENVFQPADHPQPSTSLQDSGPSTSEEARPLMSDVEPPPALELIEEEEGLERGRPTSRKRLARQDCLKVEEPKSPGADDIV